MQEPSIFTKIINGDIPSHKIYEDNETYVFLTINPLQPGHTLVIPKKQVEFVWDMDDDTYQAVMKTAKKVALHMRSVLGCKHIGSLVVGVGVPHAHVHLVPFDDDSSVLFPTNGSDEGERASDEELAAMAEKLRFS